ncbi:hypothetical protein [Streptomyces sp. NPDC048606]|uniref:hypothetical protein n=1 Tax=Streptomyces sp. NPDC048606 TaxID=3154726 RepID=UPI003425BAE1
MNRLDVSLEYDRTLVWMGLLATEAHDQIAWLGEREVDTKELIEEVELYCRACIRVGEAEVPEPEGWHHLRAVNRRLGEIDAAHRVGPWHAALTTDPAWNDIRSLAQRFLVTRLGDWSHLRRRPATDER